MVAKGDLTVEKLGIDGVGVLVEFAQTTTSNINEEANNQQKGKRHSTAKMLERHYNATQ